MTFGTIAMSRYIENDCEVTIMSVSYKKLWKILIDKDMKRKDLQEVAGISSASVAKLGKGDNITTDVLLRICEALDCTIDDILDTIKDE